MACAYILYIHFNYNNKVRVYVFQLRSYKKRLFQQLFHFFFLSFLLAILPPFDLMTSSHFRNADSRSFINVLNFNIKFRINDLYGCFVGTHIFCP